jgi:hypothetical protein
VPTKHSVKAIDRTIGLYEYRGVEIYRDDSVSSGYWERYTYTGQGLGRQYATYLKEVKRAIDAHLDG